MAAFAFVAHRRDPTTPADEGEQSYGILFEPADYISQQRLRLLRLSCGLGWLRRTRLQSPCPFDWLS